MKSANQSIKKLVKRTFEKHSVVQITADTLKNIIKSEGYFVAKFSTLSPIRQTENKLEELGIAHYTEYYDSFTYSDRSTRVVFIRGDVSDEEYVYLLSLELGKILTHSENSGNIIGLSAKDTQTAHEFAYHIKDLSQHGLLYNTLKYYTARSVAGISAAFVCLVMFISSFIADQQSDFLANAVPPVESSVISAFINTDIPTPDIQEDSAHSNSIIPETTDKASDVPANDSFITPESNITYYATANGEKYHLEGCSYIKDKNTVAITQADISSGKYSPCSRCFK